jgi:hypothetical protein
MSKRTTQSLKKNIHSASILPNRQSVMTEVTSTKSAPSRSLSKEVKSIPNDPSHPIG